MDLTQELELLTQLAHGRPSEAARTLALALQTVELLYFKRQKSVPKPGIFSFQRLKPHAISVLRLALGWDALPVLMPANSMYGSLFVTDHSMIV